METRTASGWTDLPGYGAVRWTAQELTLPDGSVFSTVLESATTSNDLPLGDEGRRELIFWESMTA